MGERLSKQYIVEKTNWIKYKKNFFYMPLEKNISIVDVSVFGGDRTITFTIKHGFLASEQIEYKTINFDDIDDFFELISDPKEVKRESPLASVMKASSEPVNIIPKTMSEKMNNIGTLRDHLFTAIENLANGTIPPEQAKAMAALAQTIINTARIELDYKKASQKDPDIKMLNS